MTTRIVPVLMAGGGGTRLWPLSRDTQPKQFCPLTSDRSLFQEALLRFQNQALYTAPLVLTHDDYRFIAQEQCTQLNITPRAIGLETARRDTGVVAVLAALMVDPDDYILLAAADHVIAKPDAFHAAVKVALPAAEQGYIITFGITPDRAETGYGYIEHGDNLGTSDVKIVKRFVEKPNAATAQTYLDSGNFVWNSGIFLAQAKTIINEINIHTPALLTAARACVKGAEHDLGFTRFRTDDLNQAPKISVDYSLMEKTKMAAVIPVAMGWSDIGSWLALWQQLPKDNDGNVASPHTSLHSSINSYIRASDKPIVAIGLRDMAVVDTPDALLVMHMQQSQNLKTALEKAPPAVVQYSHTTAKVWGHLTTLHNGDERVRRVNIDPGQGISYQSHAKRTEHWFIISGQGQVVLNDIPQDVLPGASITILPQTKHMIRNTGPNALIFMEVQTGDFMDETDVVRYLQDTPHSLKKA